MARQLIAHGGLPNTSSIPGPAKRLLDKRCDEVTPTLVFSEEEMETAKTMFSMGRFRKGYFEDVTKEYLLLPKAQHKLLTQNIELEKALKDIDGKNPRFNPVKHFRDNLIRLGIDFRITQRPVILSVGINTDLARFIRYYTT